MTTRRGIRGLARLCGTCAVALMSVGYRLDALPQTIGVNFLGATFSESGAIPPDPSGAAGPTQFALVFNDRIKVFDKTGGAGPLDMFLEGFFQSVLPPGQIAFSPRIVYDRHSARWFVSASTVDPNGGIQPPNRILLAVSSGPEIQGLSNFSFFQFQHDLLGPTPNADTGGFADSPTLGVDANAIYIGVNVISPTTSAFASTTGFVIRKSSVLTGGPIVVTAFRQLATLFATGPYSPVGVTNDDLAATEGYFVGVDLASFGVLQIRRISDPGGVPTISGNLTLDVPATQVPRTVPALHSTLPLRGGDDRLGSAQIKDGSLWTAHTINVDADATATTTAGTTGRNGVRFYEIVDLTATPTLRQSGTLFDDTTVSFGTARHYWVPSIAASGQGHVAIGISMAAPTNSAGTEIRPSAGVAGRLRTDTLGTIQAPTIVAAGTGNYNLQTTGSSQLWGNYSTTTVDPADNMTMWTVQEYSNGAINDSWGLRVAQIMAPPPAIPSSASPDHVVRGASYAVSVTGMSVAGSGFYDPGAAFPNRLSASVDGGDVTVNAITFTDPTTIALDITVAAGAVLGPRTITVTNPDGQQTTSASGILTIDPEAVSYTIVSSAGAHGSIAPSGNVIVNPGDDQTFVITADPGYHFDQLWVDGVTVAATTYTFQNVAANHTIAASFAIDSYTISASADPHGSISPSGTVPVDHGSNQTFTITPDAGYQVADVMVDGASVGGPGSYTFVNITANHTIVAHTVNPPPTITAPADVIVEATSPAGAIVPDGVLGTATATDNAPGVALARTGVPVGNQFPLGMTEITYLATDSVGLTATAVQHVTVRDTTPPAITITVPTTGLYTLNQTVIASYTCIDAASPVTTCNGPVPSGTALNTSAGPHSFTVTAIDGAGNTSTKTVSYSVSYEIRLLYDPTRANKAGGTIPIRLQLYDASSHNVSSAAIVLSALDVVKLSDQASSEVEDAGNSQPDSDFRFDATLGGSGGYIFNLKTAGFTTGTYVLRFRVSGDVAIHATEALFQVR